MLIPFRSCVERAGTFSSVVHIGAHLGEEAGDYKANGVKSVVWFEANRNLMAQLFENTQKHDMKQEYFCAVLSDKDGEEVNFSITNNGQSSSILELGTHKIYHPHIHVVDSKKLQTKRFDTLAELNRNKIDLGSVDFINLDVQGAELKVLQGFGSILGNFKNIKAVYTEVNSEEVYVGCALAPQIDAFLGEFGFLRVATKMTEARWGDALYLRV
jgi:FkbM family methyltransferase